MRCGSRCGPGRIRIRPCAAHEASRWKGHPAAAGAARSGDAGERLGDERGGIRVEHRHLRPRLRRPSPGYPLKGFAAESEPSEVRGDPPLLVIGRPDAHAPGGVVNSLEGVAGNLGYVVNVLGGVVNPLPTPYPGEGRVRSLPA